MEAIETFSDPRICLDVVAMAKWGSVGPTYPQCAISTALVSSDAADVEVPGLQETIHSQGRDDLRGQPDPAEEMAVRHVATGQLQERLSVPMRSPKT